GTDRQPGRTPERAAEPSHHHQRQAGRNRGIGLSASPWKAQKVFRGGLPDDREDSSSRLAGRREYRHAPAAEKPLPPHASQAAFGAKIESIPVQTHPTACARPGHRHRNGSTPRQYNAPCPDRNRSRNAVGHTPPGSPNNGRIAYHRPPETAPQQPPDPPPWRTPTAPTPPCLPTVTRRKRY